MGKLIIKGHTSRGEEVIKILEMLGGSVCIGKQLVGNLKHYGYYINSCDFIEFKHHSELDNDNDIIYSIEEFLEKYPYKVGDNVIAYAGGCIALFTIQDIRWNDKLNKVEYKICSSWLDTSVIFYPSYKEETMEEQKKDYEEWFPTDYLEFENNDDTWADEVEVNLGKDYEIQIRGDKTFIVKKKPQYPKSYEECAKIMNCPKGAPTGWLFQFDATIKDTYYRQLDILMTKFAKLLICRDAYWKIAGDWKYDVNKTEEYFYIVNKCGRIVKEHYMNFNHILAFPTEEIRDAFYENFKDLIEECKTFL